MEIAQVLYDVQFVTYLKKTFLEESQQQTEGRTRKNDETNQGSSPMQNNESS
jgi:hypothetical protein